MNVLVTYVACAAAPAAAFWLASRSLDRLTVWNGPRRRTPAPTGPDLERLVAALQRLESDYRRLQESDLPGRVGRMRTVALAYDDTLLACCLALGLPRPDPPPLGPVARLETEAALAQHGLTW